MNLRIAACSLFSVLALCAADPKVMPLWPNGAPGSEGKTAPESVRTTPDGEHVYSSVHQPSLTLYLPESGSTGAAVIIAPGGGHSELWADHEGFNVAKWLSAHGVAGIVLKYRLAREKGSTYTIDRDEMADMQRAIQLAHEHAAEWGLKPDRIGVMGFSAGGVLAALASIRFHPVSAEVNDKPAFQALLYPELPADRTFSKETPPAFLVCGENDRQNISQGLPEYYVAMKKAGASAELHVFAGVGHGFGLRERTRGPVAGWPEAFRAWLEARGFLKP
jgi:acetyl esterase/lipase